MPIATPTAARTSGQTTVRARTGLGHYSEREFRTIDFLTWIDVESPAVAALKSRGHFVG